MCRGAAVVECRPSAVVALAAKDHFSSKFDNGANRLAENG